jgi:hypothetical protein
VSKCPDRRRGALDLVYEDERRGVPRIRILLEVYRPEKLLKGQIALEQGTVLGPLEIEVDVLPYGPTEGVYRRGLAGLPGAADDKRFSGVRVIPRFEGGNRRARNVNAPIIGRNARCVKN